MGLNSWSDSPSVIENAMLHVFNKTNEKKSNKVYLAKSDQVWWCADFNNNKCSFQSLSHQKSVKGHICAWFTTYVAHAGHGRMTKINCSIQNILLLALIKYDSNILFLILAIPTHDKPNFSKIFKPFMRRHLIIQIQ